MAPIKNLIIVTGEPSGDLLASTLAAAIKELNPQIKISAVGGRNLEKAGCEIFYDIKELAIMGLFDVLKNLPKFFNLKKLILKKIGSQKPDAIILVDFSGFNLRLAKAINKKIPVIYYVSPQVWASREGRINTIKKFISLMVVLFEFEEKFYAKNGIKVFWAGHPLLDTVKPALKKEEFADKLGISPSEKIIALLPGSRKQEIKIILPIMLKTASIIKKTIPQAQFVVAKAANLDPALYESLYKEYKLNLKIIEGKTYDCLNSADVSLVCSGTATLEAAIITKPYLIVYKTNFLNYLLYRPQIKVPYIGMVNIVAGKRIVPEFIQFGANPKKISDSILKLLQNQEYACQLTQNLLAVKNSLGEPGASARAAKLILDYLQNRR